MSPYLRFPFLFVLVFVLCCSGRSYGQPASKATTGVSEIANRFRIEVVDKGIAFPVRTTHGQISGDDADPASLRNYVDLFAQEFCLYPVTLIQKIQLKRVVLCTQLAYAGQRRNAIPDFEHNTLYLEVKRGNYDRVYMRQVIHHELFHIIDYHDDRSLYQDQRWSNLNPKAFVYGTGGRNAQNLATTSLLTNESPGFLNHYSTTGVEEDKAEVFATMIVNPTYVNNRIKNDDVLAVKVQMMKRLLIAFCPEMNDEYWRVTIPAFRQAQPDVRTGQ
jgi:hypothetical protein